MESEPIRHLSQELFLQIKGPCVQVAQLAQLHPLDPDPLVYQLRQLHTTLDAHRRHHDSASDYVVSPKIADYIFFPISCVLKHEALPSSAVQYILHILAYLTETSWMFSADDAALDQMLPLVVFLTNDRRDSSDNEGFRLAAAECLSAVLKSVPTTYFQSGATPKRLAVLGDSTNTLLSLLATFGPSQEQMAQTILSTLPWLYSSRVSADHTSLVFPGIVSKVINFHSKTKNLHTDTLVLIVALLTAFAVKVFDQKDLDVVVSDTKPSLETVKSLHLQERQPGEAGQYVDLCVKKPHHNRTSSWLRATAQQFRLSVLIFMRNLIMNSTTANKIRTNSKLGEAIVKFAREIYTRCFRPLFNDLVLANLDILSALCYVQCKDSQQETQFLDTVASIYIMAPRTDLQLLHKHLLFKTETLAAVQLPKTLATLNEEKIAMCLAAVRLHVRILECVSDALMCRNSLDGVVRQTVENVAFFLGQNLGAKKQRPGKTGLLTSGKMVEKMAEKMAGKMTTNFMDGDSTQAEASLTTHNSVDGIELPPHIDAKNLSVLSPKDYNMEPYSGRGGLSQLHVDLNSHGEKPRFFGAFLSQDSEACIQATLTFLGAKYVSDIEHLSYSLLENTQTRSHVVSLWVINQLVAASPQAFDVDEFLDFGEETQFSEEICYILLSHAQQVLESIQDEQVFLKSLVASSSQAVQDQMKNSMQNQVLQKLNLQINDTMDQNLTPYEVFETSYVVALETLGLVAGRLSKEDFSADVLMDHLFPLLEALTFSPTSIVHQQAMLSLSQIVQVHYNSSLQLLVKENSDYLIDSISSQLSVASGLTPSLPGILLVVLKISGMDLLMQNQLHDVLSQIFIVIDSYHGYSVLVENFFYVFEEIVVKTSEMYAREISDGHKIGSSRPYKPWGISSISEMLDMIDDSNRKVDPFEYDQDKEYFKNPGVPFGGDSDDEEEDGDGDGIEGDGDGIEGDGNGDGNDSAHWICPIPQNVYMLIQQIFTYGLQLLSHPSVKLRVQVLKTLKKAYGLMSTNYSTLMPLLAQYWSLLLVLSAGTKTMSEYDDSVDVALMDPALELMISIFEEDARHENFLAGRFTDMWAFMKRAWQGKTQGKTQRKMELRLPVTKKYCRLLVQGINNYGRQIPDLTCHDMMRYCYSVGISKDLPLGRTVKNHLYVLKQAQV